MKTQIMCNLVSKAGLHNYIIIFVALQYYIHAVDKISTLLELENELGTSSEYTPALDDVLSYFETVR
jgi:hypothetical protein